jgi:spermidine/putrescine transport system permease protein
VPGLKDAMVLSLEIALLAAIVATALGTLIALALVRYGFRGRGVTNLLIFLPMTTPEIVMGASLLALFLNLGVATGFWTIFIAHVMFCISFVVVTVKARLVGFDRHLEEAAMDLGANPFSTFGRVTLPLIAPGIAAGALLAFALSIDDFVISQYLASGADTTTVPMRIYAQARNAPTPALNALATIMLVVSLAALVLAWLAFKWLSRGRAPDELLVGVMSK